MRRIIILICIQLFVFAMNIWAYEEPPVMGAVDNYKSANQWQNFGYTQRTPTIVVSGTCGKNGNNLTWTFNDEGELTIEGKGYMDDYTSKTKPAPWDEYKEDILSVVVAEGVNSIGDDAFCSCNALDSIELPNSITSIGRGALYFCSSLTSLIIPDGVTNLAEYLCQGCTSLKTVSIPKSVTSIEGTAFGECKALESVALPNEITSIGDYAFVSCTSMTSIVLPEKLSYIGKKAFENCKTLSTITLPKKVENIDGWAFIGCSNLSSLRCEAIVPPTCGLCCFAMIDNSIPVYVPSSSVEAYRGADEWSAFTNIQAMPERIVASGTCGENLTWALTSEDLLKIEGVGNMYTYDYSKLPWNDYRDEIQSVDVKEGVTSICYNAFRNMTLLTNVSIPASIKSIGSCAFDNTPWLESLVDEDGIKYYNNIPLKYTGSNKNIKIKDGVTCLNTGLFYGSDVETCQLPLSVTEIPEYFFEFCSRIKDFVVPNTIKTLPWGMMKNGYNLQRDCQYVPGSVNYIQLYAVNNAKNLVIEDSETSLYCRGRNAKDGLWSGAFSDVENIYIGCKEISTDGYEYSQIFNDSGISTHIKEITFGPNVQEAFKGLRTFKDCKELTTLVCLSKQPFTCPDFENYPYYVKRYATLYVPKGYLQTYKEASGWKDIANIQEVENVTLDVTDFMMVYTGDYDLDFTNINGLNAYYVSKYADGVITKTKAGLVPAGEAVIIEATPGTYTIPCVDIKTPDTIVNLLKGTISGKFIRQTDDTNINFEFSHNSDGYNFGIVDAVYGKQLYRNQAYLSIPSQDIGEVTAIDIKPSCSIVDGQLYSNIKDVDCEEISYSRNFKNTNWQALYIPFSMSYSDWADDFEVAYINDVHQYDYDEDGQIDDTAVEIIKIKNGATEANEQYLIRAKETGEKTISVEDATLYATEENSFDVSSRYTLFTFTGTYNTIPGSVMMANGYYALGGGALHQTTSAEYDLSPFRWYMAVTDRNGNSKALSKVRIHVAGEEDTETGIVTLYDTKPESDVIYDLSGRRVNTPSKGIFIKNGKKYVAK